MNNIIDRILNITGNIKNMYGNTTIDTDIILSVLCMVFILAMYELIVYRLVSHRTFYNKSFHISIAIIPFFIATIILCLQSNLVITLGTIGALAIIRFRTAVKDPIDMMYILWAVHTGIVCGCQLYEVAVLTSIIVTLTLLLLENVSFGKKPFILIIHCKENEEPAITKILNKNTRRFRIKSRNFTTKGVDYAIELSIHKTQKLINDLKNSKKIERFSMIEYDADDIV